MSNNQALITRDSGGEIILSGTFPGRFSGRLETVLNPLGRAIVRGVDLNALFDASPADGERLLAELVGETSNDLKAAISKGGVFYRLVGASPEHSTPMQYGGHYLERDRELLEAVKGQMVVVFVEGADAYLDFVSDLPATVFGWDAARTKADMREIRAMRPGLIMADDEAADIRFKEASVVA